MNEKLEKLIKLRFLPLLVTTEIVFVVLIVILGINIYNTLRSRNPFITNIKNVSNNTRSELKYFYQPIANSTFSDSPSWLGYTSNYTINSQGFNDRYTYQVQVPSKTFRIITLGDSFTFGQYVSTSKNYSELLEDKLNSGLNCKNIDNFEVINLGVAGYDIEYTVERFINTGLPLSPNLVLWLVNDWNFSIINELMKPINIRLLSESKETDQVKKIESAWIDSQITLKNTYGEKYIAEYQENILMNLYKKYNNKLLILYFPEKMLHYKSLIDKFVSKSNSFSQAQIDISYWGNKEYQLYDHHPNELGHRKISEAIFNILAQKEFLNCKIY